MSVPTRFEALERAWRDFASRLDPRWAPGGITFHGDATDLPWVAVVLEPKTRQSGPEGWGRNPFDALRSLEIAVHAQDNHPELSGHDLDEFLDGGELAKRWQELGRWLPERWSLGGVTFQAADTPRGWAAYVVQTDSWNPGLSAEGADPLDAIRNLEAEITEYDSRMKPDG